MQWIILAFLLPELLALAWGIVRIVCALNGTGDLPKIPDLRPRKKKVSSAYWGTYAGVSAAGGTMTIPTPKIYKPREFEPQEPDWTG
jgi:hypothetical protein